MNKIILIFVITFVCLGCNLIDGITKESDSTTPKPDDTAVDATPVAESAPDSLDLDTSQKKDLLSIGAGAYLISASSEYTPGDVSRWSAFGLIDEGINVGWASKTNSVTDQSIVFELPSRTTLKTIGFDTANVDTAGSAAKDVSIEISDTSATEGFSELLSVSLKDQADGQNFPILKPTPGRWIRINARNNHGSKEWLEIMEIRGYGDQEKMEPLKNVSGTYETGKYGKFHIKQEGSSIIGCYESNGGTLSGGIDGKVMTLNWKEGDGTGEAKGPSVFLFDRDAKEFVGLWGYENGKSYAGKWDGKKISDQVGSCEHAKGLDNENAIQTSLEDTLKKDGRALVYGINFDFNSDKIKDESKTTLDQISSILKENADWKMTIEGHTDNVGGAKFNQGLSEKRAQSVRKYLVAIGIDESRLTATGIGMDKPIAKNDSEAGRARNRRVELVKK